MRLVSATRRWVGRCIVAASGPSLTPEAAEICRGERVIAVNDAYRLLPWADVTYACDAAWWNIHRQNVLSGERWTSHSLSPKNDKRGMQGLDGFRVIAGAEGAGFSMDPAKIHYGNNSGYQAVNLAILFGADPIVLVGFDMRAIDGKRHFFGNHKAPLTDGHSFATWINNFERAAKLLSGGPRIINSTPDSALKCFPFVPLAEAINQRIAA